MLLFRYSNPAIVLYKSMVSLLIRMLALLGLLWTGKQVAHQVSSAFHPRKDVDGNPSGQEIQGDMVKDPVCQTYIPKSLAIEKKIEGQIYYFCGAECATKFLEQAQPKTS